MGIYEDELERELHGFVFGEVVEAASCAFGVPVFRDLGSGRHGVAFAADGEKVLKVTTSPSEAALCATILAAATAGRGHPGLPAVHDVIRIEGTSDEVVVHGILREDLRDVFPAPSERSGIEATLFSDCLRYVSTAFASGLPALARGAVATWRPKEPCLGNLVDALTWLRTEFGVEVGDLGADNVGLSAGGYLCLRDLGAVSMPATARAAALAGIRGVPVDRASRPSP